MLQEISHRQYFIQWQHDFTYITSGFKIIDGSTTSRFAFSPINCILVIVIFVFQTHKYACEMKLVIKCFNVFSDKQTFGVQQYNSDIRQCLMLSAAFSFKYVSIC